MGRVRLRRVRGLRSSLGNVSDTMLRDARIPNPGPTIHFTARGRRLTPKAEGHARSLSGGPGLGVPRHPHPRQSRASEQKLVARRGEGTQPGDLCGAQPARPKAPRAGGRDRGRPQEAPPTCPPCALRHQAGTRTLGRSRLEGLALGTTVQGPGPPTLQLGDDCLGGHLRDNGSWESLFGDLTWL